MSLPRSRAPRSDMGPWPMASILRCCSTGSKPNASRASRSACVGENITARSPATHSYGGPTLLEQLEGIEVNEAGADEAFRFPVQWVNRPDSSFRGYAGTIAGGTARAGDHVVVARTGGAA